MNSRQLIEYVAKRYPGALMDTQGDGQPVWHVFVKLSGQNLKIQYAPENGLQCFNLARGESGATAIRITDLEAAKQFVDDHLGSAAAAQSDFELDTLKLEKSRDFSAIFGRKAPLIVEIGCGAGRTSIAMALAHPENNYIAIEQAGDYYRELHQRVAKRKMTNLKTARLDAAYLIKQFFPDNCVNDYHIYFPDPWPKKRHHKRRLISEWFCAELRRTLIPNGILWFATDHKEYYEEALPRLRTALKVEEHPQPWEDAPEGRTNYEVKYIKEGRPIYRLIGRKC